MFVHFFLLCESTSSRYRTTNDLQHLPERMTFARHCHSFHAYTNFQIRLTNSSFAASIQTQILFSYVFFFVVFFLLSSFCFYTLHSCSRNDTYKYYGRHKTLSPSFVDVAVCLVWKQHFQMKCIFFLLSFMKSQQIVCLFSSTDNHLARRIFIHKIFVRSSGDVMQVANRNVNRNSQFLFDLYHYLMRLLPHVWHLAKTCKHNAIVNRNQSSVANSTNIDENTTLTINEFLITHFTPLNRRFFFLVELSIDFMGKWMKTKRSRIKQ